MDVLVTDAFRKSALKAGATQADLDKLAKLLRDNPETGDVIPQLGGIRKVRFGIKGKGKRGGARGIYVVLRMHELIILLLAYSKDSQEDLSAAQKKAVSKVVEEIKRGLRAG